MTNFAGAEGIWSQRLGSLRNVVRQHVVAEQLAEHVDDVRNALDVGCGQGTQALRLAERGIAVTGVDPSAGLLAEFVREAAARRLTVRAVHSDLGALSAVLPDEQFDLVCAHGLLMYLTDARAGVATLTTMMAPGGRLSFTVRNGDALALRPGLRGDFRGALAAFDATSYRNDLGVDARAHSMSDIRAWCEEQMLDIQAWYGVRVLTDPLPASTRPDEVDLAACLRAEVEAGRRDPYRRLGSMLHVVARKRRPADRRS